MTKRAQQTEISFLVKGFDLVVSVHEELPDTYHVVIGEQGNQVYEVDVPINLDEFEGDNEEIDGSDKIFEFVGQAAVDLFEADRDTLGQGAGATMANKRAYCESQYWEDWFMGLKGTPFEEEAASLLEQYLNTFDPDPYQSEFQEDLYSKLHETYHEMDLLNFERMKSAVPGQTFIVIQGRRKDAYFYETEFLQEYLDKFLGHQLEYRAVELAKEMIDTQNAIEAQEEVDDSSWKEQQELSNAMQELSMRSLETDLAARTPDMGIDVAPNMAQDVADMMDGVELNEPLVEMSEGSQAPKTNEFPAVFGRSKSGGVFDDKTQELFQEIMVDPTKKSRAQEIVSTVTSEMVPSALSSAFDPEGGKPGTNIDYDLLADMVETGFGPTARTAGEDDDEDTDEPREVEQLGEDRGGLQPAEVEQQAFNTNERIQLKVDVKVPTSFGSVTMPKGTKGYAESAWNGTGDIYLMRSDKGKLFKVKYDQIKSIKK